jgi:hypothetical protein
MQTGAIDYCVAVGWFSAAPFAFEPAQIPATLKCEQLKLPVEAIELVGTLIQQRRCKELVGKGLLSNARRP